MNFLKIIRMTKAIDAYIASNREFVYQEMVAAIANQLDVNELVDFASNVKFGKGGVPYPQRITLTRKGKGIVATADVKWSDDQTEVVGIECVRNVN